jgi:pimeloyl-ACP methyl ester carboxylesterase
MRPLALILCLGALQLAQAAADEWPGENWNEKLTESYEKWKPIQEVLADLAQLAGVRDVTFTVERNPTSVVPLPAGLTRKEAFQSAASMCLLEGQWEGGKLTVRETKKRGDWQTLIGAVSIPILVDGARGTLLMPSGKKIESPAPWVWFAPNGLDSSHAWICKRLLDEGISIASVGVGESQGNPQGRAVFTAFYEKITAEHGTARKAVLFPQSRGGLMLYNWAAEHPECVAAIGGIYPVGDLRSYPKLEKASRAYGVTQDELLAQLAQHNPIDRLAPLAKAGIPIFHVHGDRDGTVPLEANSAEIARRYQALGGKVELMIIPGKGHETAATGQSFFQCEKLADFLIKQAKATTP